jgi:hypothetical protein
MRDTRNKADLHMHSTYSDGLMTPETLVEYIVEKTDLSVIAVTDHNTIEGAVIAQAYANHFADDLNGLEVIIGSEIRARGMEVIGLWIQQDVPAGLSPEETIERIHAQGGLAIAPHPYSFALEAIGITGMMGARDRIRDLPFDAIEAINGTPTEIFGNPYTRYKNRRWANLPETGGTDAHYIHSLGATYTLFEGNTAADLRHAIETGQIEAGGTIYNPFLIFNLMWDGITRQIPLHTLPAHRAAEWHRVQSKTRQSLRVPAL